MTETGTGVTSQHPIRHKRPVVAIIGRPNVGKSTLFNRLIGTRRAIVDDFPGVTRDVIHAETTWDGLNFTLADTGGFIPRSKDGIAAAVCAQAELAISESDVVILLVDKTTGATDVDREVAQLLLRAQIKSLLVVNKVDTPESDTGLEEFLRLGMGDPFPVSASTGRKSGDLLEEVVSRFGAQFRDVVDEPDPAIHLVLVGRPNVGKSTLMNRLAGHSVSVVHDEPGTTRDSTHVRISTGSQDYVLSDTAGLRRRSKVDEAVEYYSGLRASESISKANVAVALIDGTEGVTLQDLRVMNQVVDAGCALVIAVNKWDLADRAQTTGEVFRQDLYGKYPHLAPYQVLFISALTGRNVIKSLEAVDKAYATYSSRITTASLNRMLNAIAARSPPAQGGREVRLLYATQQAVAPPTFVVFSNRPDLIKSSYRRFFENQLRDQFDFRGTPIRTFWRTRRSQRPG